MWIALDVGAAWTVSEHLAALQIDALTLANWQRSKDGRKGRNKPKPIERPGTKRTSPGADPDKLDRQIAAFRARQARRQRAPGPPDS